jgi:flagellar motor protein MotB
MVSYADMITIVMAFFVVLYATSSGAGKHDKGHSTKDNKPEAKASGSMGEKGKEGDSDAQNEKLKQVMHSLYDRFGPNWTLANCWIGGPTAIHRMTPAEFKAKAGDKRAVSLAHGTPNGKSSITVCLSKPSDTTIPGGRILFEEFSAKLDDSQTADLAFVARELAGKTQRIEIRGHASRRPLPPDSTFHDHFDLAYARCRAVCNFLQSHGIDSQRMRISVSAENEPASDVLTPPAYGQIDSRVEIRLLNEWLKAPDLEQSVSLPSAPAKVAE